MAYASGKYARAMCDRCGFEMAYTELLEEWTGFMVCGECFDERHPQDDPQPHSADAEALYKPRPDQDRELTIIKAGETKMIDGTYIPAIRVKGYIGSVTVTTT